MGKVRRRRRILGVSAARCPNCGSAGLLLTESRDVPSVGQRFVPRWDDRRRLRLRCPACHLRFLVEQTTDPDPVDAADPVPPRAAPVVPVPSPGPTTTDRSTHAPLFTEAPNAGVAADEPVTEFFTDDDEPPAPQRRRRHARGAAAGGARRSALRRLLLSLGALGLVLTLLVAGAAWFLVDRYAGNLDRVGDVFAAVPADGRPAPAQDDPATGEAPVTFLLVGSDTRAQITGSQLPDARSDTIMLVRLAGDRKQAQVVSIPRDSWVDIPGHGMNKINASYAFGGPALLVQTVEQLTGVRIDHYLAISFEGLVRVTDDLGGVTVQVAQTTTNGPYTFPAGANRLDGDQARWYVGQRYGLPGGDFDRVKRQQQYLRAMATQLVNGGVFTDLGRVDSVLRTVTANVAVDDTLGPTTLLDLAWSARDIRPADIGYFTAPVLGTGTEGAANVVYLDPVAGDHMWGYLRSDSLGPNAAEFATEALPAVPN